MKDEGPPVPRPIIGQWFLELPTDEMLHNGPLSAAATAVERAVAVLQEAQLLLPLQVKLHRWIEATDKIFEGADVPDLELAVEGSIHASWLECQGSEHSANFDHPTAIPEITVTGSTVILTAGGEHRESGIMALRVNYEGTGITAFLTTYTDVWMMDDSSGRPQADRAALNAPRLRMVLQQLAKHLHSEVEPADPTRFAVPTKDGLAAIS
jgi:hypothetical protein